MSVVHPRVAAERITELVREIALPLEIFGTLRPAPEEVSPQPCDDVERTRTLEASGTSDRNPYADPWYVDYSPYTTQYIGYADVASPGVFSALLSRTRDVLSASGWRPREVVLEGDRPSLLIEGPEDGYGARILGITTEAGQPRVAVYVSSPCLQHPEAGRVE